MVSCGGSFSSPYTAQRLVAETVPLQRFDCPVLLHSEAFDDGQALLRVAEKHGLEGVVSKRRDAPYRSGACRGWRKIKTTAWREANRERWRLFERN
jgi:ATP-dependent DNA ligase